MRVKHVLMVAISAGLYSGAALAEQPANPGCFGQDRAAALKLMQQDLFPGVTPAPGASEWGKIASERASDNGQINRDYKTGCGGAPAKGNPLP